MYKNRNINMLLGVWKAYNNIMFNLFGLFKYLNILFCVIKFKPNEHH